MAAVQNTDALAVTAITTGAAVIAAYRATAADGHAQHDMTALYQRARAAHV